MRISGNEHKRGRDRGKRDQKAMAKHGVDLPAQAAAMTIGVRATLCKGRRGGARFCHGNVMADPEPSVSQPLYGMTELDR
jgi:hypothetical protein